MESYQILPSGTYGLAKLKNLTQNYQSLLQKYPGLSITQNEYLTFDHQTDFINYTVPMALRNTPVGYAEIIAGRFAPRSLFRGPNNKTTLVNSFVKGLQDSQNIYDIAKPTPAQIYSTGPFNHPDGSMTGVNPAWRDELWEIVYAGGWVKGTSQTLQDRISNGVNSAMDNIRNITPGGGCYMNEAHPLEADWQTAFFGANYDRLLSIKQRYDPTTFFNCWKCVGWTGAAE